MNFSIGAESSRISIYNVLYHWLASKCTEKMENWYPSWGLSVENEIVTCYHIFGMNTDTRSIVLPMNVTVTFVYAGSVSWKRQGERKQQ